MAETGLNSTTLAAIRKVVDPAQRASLLLDAVEACSHARNCPEPASELLAELVSGLRQIPERFRTVELLLRVANLEEQLGQMSQAAIIREKARQLAMDAEGPGRGALLVKVGLAERRGLSTDPQEGSEALVAEGVRRLTDPPDQRAPFPFTPLPTELELGVAVSGSSFRDSNGAAVVSLDLYRQGRRQDLDVDLTGAAEYDSTRTYNAIRPNGFATLFFRHHLDDRWNLFFDQLVSVNNDTFASKDDDDDLSVISVSLVGVGLNLWRGRTPASFVEAQLGVGVRYEYELLDRQKVSDQLDPNLALLLRAREVPLGAGRFNQILAIGTLTNDWSNSFAWSATSVKFPLSKRWWWNNELVLRYRTEPVAIGDPKLNAIFSTGLVYKF